MSKKNIAIALGIIIILVIIIAFVRMNPKQDAMENSGTTATSTSETSGSNTTGGTSGKPTGGATQGGVVSGFTFKDFTLRMGQATLVNGVKITPLAVEQDSRCAINVQCIQAGSVRVSMKFEFNNYSATQSVVSGNEATVYGVTGTIIQVSPDKVLGKEIGEKEYSFVLRVKTKV